MSDIDEASKNSDSDSAAPAGNAPTENDVSVFPSAKPISPYLRLGKMQVTPTFLPYTKETVHFVPLVRLGLEGYISLEENIRQSVTVADEVLTFASFYRLVTYTAQSLTKIIEVIDKISSSS